MNRVERNMNTDCLSLLLLLLLLSLLLLLPCFEEGFKGQTNDVMLQHAVQPLMHFKVV